MLDQLITPGSAARPGRASLSQASARQGRHDREAGLLVALLVIAIRLSIGLEAGWLMLLPLFVATILVTRLSPPVAALFLLYGWVLLGPMDFPGLWLLPRIPTISTLTLWTIGWLVYWQGLDGSLGRLTRPGVIRYLLAMLALLAIGLGMAFVTGRMASSLVRFYNWDVVRTWLGYLIVGMLACRNLRDLEVLLLGLPLAFLIYPLSLPLEAWQGFFRQVNQSSNILTAGLSYGSLNSNALGQAAAVASVVVISLVLARQRARHPLWMLVLFLLCAALAFLTGSRQALLGWVAGLVVAGAAAGRGRGTVLLVALGLLLPMVMLALGMFLPAGSGFLERWLEFAQPVTTWETRSWTTRVREFQKALQMWTQAPILGAGFGGQSFARVLQIEHVSGQASWVLRGTHNLLLGILVQTGLVGLVLFAAFTVGIAWRSLGILNRASRAGSGEARAARVAVLAMLACIFVQQNISGGLGTHSSALLFLLGALLGLIGAQETGAWNGPQTSDGQNQREAREQSA